MGGRVVERADWASDPEAWRGEWEGNPDAGVSVIFHQSEGPGHGPELHTHPYPETFIILEGRAQFTVGDLEVAAEAGQILVAPADTPHAFRSTGPGVFRSVNIHRSERFVTIWL